MNSIVKVVDGISWQLEALTPEAAEQARVSLTDLASALGYHDRGAFRELAHRHRGNLKEFGEVRTVSLSVVGSHVPRTIQEPMYTADQAAYLALSCDTSVGRACRVRIIQAYKALQALVVAQSPKETAIVSQARALLAQAEELAALDQRVSMLEGHIQPDPQYYTILGWCNILGRRVSTPQASALGREASALSRQDGYDIVDVRDPRYGTVHQYHEDILARVVGPAPKG